FFYAGYDQHIFNVPSVVEFLNGSTTVVPQPGTYPSILDYEVCPPSVGGSACDSTQVLAAAGLLSQNGGMKRAQLLGETGSLRLDHVLTSRQYVSLRVSAARS